MSDQANTKNKVMNLEDRLNELYTHLGLGI